MDKTTTGGLRRSNAKITFAAIAVMTLSLGALAASKFDSSGPLTNAASLTDSAGTPTVGTQTLLGHLNTAE